MSNVLDAIPTEPRAVIVEELMRFDPALLAELRATQAPTNKQRESVESVLARVLVKSFGPDWEPSARGLAVERAISAFFEAWPMDE